MTHVSAHIYTAPSHIPGAGRGVFASIPIRKGDIIEQCPYLPIPDHEAEHISESFLITYIYYLGEAKDNPVLLLGYGSLYNHSDTPNAYYREQPDQQVMDIIAVRDIGRDEEITLNYNPEGGKAPLWFRS